MQVKNFVSVLETTMYLVAANLPPLRSLVTRIHKATVNFLRRHHAMPRLKQSTARPRQWFRRLRRADEESNGHAKPQSLDDSPRARLGYISNQQVTRFEEDLQEEIEGTFGETSLREFCSYIYYLHRAISVYLSPSASEHVHLRLTRLGKLCYLQRKITQLTCYPRGIV